MEEMTKLPEKPNYYLGLKRCLKFYKCLKMKENQIYRHYGDQNMRLTWLKERQVIMIW